MSPGSLSYPFTLLLCFFSSSVWFGLDRFYIQVLSTLSFPFIPPSHFPFSPALSRSFTSDFLLLILLRIASFTLADSRDSLSRFQVLPMYPQKAKSLFFFITPSLFLSSFSHSYSPCFQALNVYCITIKLTDSLQRLVWG